MQKIPCIYNYSLGFAHTYIFILNNICNPARETLFVSVENLYPCILWLLMQSSNAVEIKMRMYCK